MTPLIGPDPGGVRARGRLPHAERWGEGGHRTSTTGWAAPNAFARAVDRSGLDAEPDRAFCTWIGVAAVAAVTAPSTAMGPMILLVVAVGPPLALFATRGRRAAIRRRHLPIALDTVASALRSGRSVRHALAEAADAAGPLSTELRDIAARAAAGRRLADELAGWAEGDDADIRLAGAALATAAELGGPAAAALETTAQSLRDRADANAAVDALSVQARLSALVLALAPVGFAVLMTGIDPEASRFLLGTPAGWLCLAGGVGLDVAGALWMSRIVRKSR